MKRTWLVLVFLAGGLLLAAGVGQQSGSGQGVAKKVDDKEREADREAIRKSAYDFVQAFEKGDAKAIAALWTEQGEYHDESGEMLHGRAAIEKAYAEHFK